MSDFEFCSTLYSWGYPIEQYVGRQITEDQYKQITGKDYVASKS
ncbi:phage protein [Lacticaseibacillus rhamnosus]|nr:XkdX family protein [Lacticaseibacillus rhamnosus]OAU70107.1 phage protein [Lacticaseibacillus rhamnosus]